MTNGDAMVIRPDLSGRGRIGDVTDRQAQFRVVDRQRRSNSPTSAVARRAIQRASSRSRLIAAIRNPTAPGFPGASNTRQAASANTVARGARAFAGPAILAAVVVTAIATGIRVATGQTTEDIGASIRRMFLNDLDAKGRAATASRNSFANSKEVAINYQRNGGRLLGLEQEAYRDVLEQNTTIERGRTRLGDLISSPNRFDLLVDSIIEAVAGSSTLQEANRRREETVGFLSERIARSRSQINPRTGY